LDAARLTVAPGENPLALGCSAQPQLARFSRLVRGAVLKGAVTAESDKDGTSRLL
jgi:hypothetical protein